jgi:hypothetical protein
MAIEVRDINTGMYTLVDTVLYIVPDVWPIGREIIDMHICVYTV